MNGDSQPVGTADSLGVVAEATARADETLELAARHLDPSLVHVLRILGFDKQYTSARGSYLYDAAGRADLDFHTGEGFASLGHNNPDVRDVLRATLAADLVDGVQLHYSALAGMLAEALSQRMPPGLDAVFFTSTGAEAVDSAMKFARAATHRSRLISCDSSFHGVTLGPLSLVGDEFFQEGFGPLLPGCERVPFGDLQRLEAELRGRGLMIGIELRAPRSPAGRLSWRLIHMASAGLFPQLIVIPLHRDHGVITMAAGKNDVIKLLPPLTLSEPEARSFLDALDAVLADSQGAASRNWAVVRDIATARLRRRVTHDGPGIDSAPVRGKPVDPSR